MKTSLIATLLCIVQVVAAQNVNIQFFPEKANHNRTEIVIPDGDYHVLKADLHIHTMFSDGTVWPTYRVQEAWRDGLDILAITDHIEYRPNKQYLNADLNTSYEIARPEAEKLGIMLIRGTEITRQQGVVGHFNAIFIKDANPINVENPKDAIKAARAQGAFITFNHPGWRMDACRFSPFQKEVLDEGLIDGIEAVNNHEYYARALSWCHDLNKTVIAASDAHDPIFNQFKLNTVGLENIRHRPMTLIFVKDNSQEGVREALDSRRTLGFFDGKVVGEESLLKQLFDVSVKFVQLKTYGKNTYYRIENHSSIPYRLKIGTGEYLLFPMSSISISFPKATAKVDVSVLNMYYYENTVPVFSVKL
ncbi:MAG: PHP domain-containing protein [Bacteroidales bacterium]|nr:PHP domain-containing protein [Bacteroidales bacterium]MDD4671143.1 PHP domain-containing protein [Bacteroidales bacterium]